MRIKKNKLLLKLIAHAIKESVATGEAITVRISKNPDNIYLNLVCRKTGATADITVPDEFSQPSSESEESETTTTGIEIGIKTDR